MFISAPVAFFQFCEEKKNESLKIIKCKKKKNVLSLKLTFSFLLLLTVQPIT